MAAPFPDISPRTRALRIILLTAALLGMASCLPLWTNTRSYPLVSIAPWFPIVPGPWDRILFGAVMTSLIAAFRWYRPAVTFFLAATLFLYLQDQNRGQPWMYMYWLMLLLTLFREPASVAACRFVLSAVYVWGGIQKLNPRFFQIIPAFFAKPFVDLGAPSFVIVPFRWAISAAPVIEILIGVAFWFPRARLPAAILATLIHVTALFVLGPLGHKYNLVVWPWNLAMIALIFTLFPGDGLRRAARELRASTAALIVVALVWLLPVLSYLGRWDSYFSFSLYSHSQAFADVFVTERVRDELPAELQRFVHPLRQQYNPVVQGPFVFDHQAWGDAVLGTPPLPEPRGFRVMFRHVLHQTSHPEDVKMIMSPRGRPYEWHTKDMVQGLPGT